MDVASPSQSTESLAIKARLYLAFGTRLVWVVWPSRRHVDTWHPGVATPSTLSLNGSLDGEDVVPGFAYPLASLFR